MGSGGDVIEGIFRRVGQIRRIRKGGFAQKNTSPDLNSTEVGISGYIKRLMADKIIFLLKLKPTYLLMATLVTANNNGYQ